MHQRTLTPVIVLKHGHHLPQELQAQMNYIHYFQQLVKEHKIGNVSEMKFSQQH